MAKILCIETATTNCSVAIGDGNLVLSVVEFDSKTFSHAEQLHLFIKEALEKAGQKITALDAVAISKGPGSYTGLRIGVSTAKGLCYATDIPLISCPTLEVLARQVKEKGSGYPIITMIDARRMEVYSSVFDTSYNTLQEVEAKILDEDAYADLFESYAQLNVIGSGVAKFKDITKHSGKFNFIEHKNPSAREMISIAEGKFNVQKFEDLAYFEPYYLKDFVAGK